MNVDKDIIFAIQALRMRSDSKQARIKMRDAIGCINTIDEGREINIELGLSSDSAIGILLADWDAYKGTKTPIGKTTIATWRKENAHRMSGRLIKCLQRAEAQIPNVYIEDITAPIFLSVYLSGMTAWREFEKLRGY